MMKISLIFILLLAACTLEPVEIQDDMSVLQDFINNSPNINMILDMDSSGTIEPVELGLQKWKNGRITELNCYNIGLIGNIPESIGNLTELTQLGLKSNSLSGGIPESIGNLTNLTQLNLANNTLSGSIPDTIGNLKSLTYLVLSNNEFSGSIPNSIGELSVLTTLLANSNSFSGSIPNGLCNIKNLEISNNQFCPPQPSCIDTPDEIGFQNCDTSCGSGNTYLNGYCYSQSDLNVLQDFINNADSLNMIMDIDTLEGVQPLELGFQEWQSGRLKTLDCYWDTVSCHLSAEFPVNITSLDSLKYLDLQNNALTGAIPDAISNLSALENLDLQDNSISGYLPESLCIDDTTVWIDINLKNNQFCPCYPACINKVYSNFVTDQDTSGCSYCNEGYEQVCYDFPERVTIQVGDSLCFNRDNLAVLQAFIDSSLMTFPDSLDISMLADSTSSIEDIGPLELGKLQYWENGQLIFLDAPGLGISGGVPENIGNLSSLKLLNISNNFLSGELPGSFYILQGLYSLNLSGNQLSGEINPNICPILDLDNWAKEGISSSNSYLFDNKFCPGATGYPYCIDEHMGKQDTTGCE